MINRISKYRLFQQLSRKIKAPVIKGKMQRHAQGLVNDQMGSPVPMTVDCHLNSEALRWEEAFGISRMYAQFSVQTLIILSFLLFFATTQAQVGIGTTTPDISAILDLTSTTRGMLISRLTLVQRNAITSPATGLLVYQIDNAPGYYYNAGTPGVPNWVRFFSGSDAGGWDLAGNTGTTVGTNFLGTTDAQDFSIYTNNAERIRVTSTGNVGIGTTAPETTLDISGNTPNDLIQLRSGASTQWHLGIGDAGGNYFSLYEEGQGANPRMVVEKITGDVGIGISNPATALHISRSEANTQLLVENTQSAALLYPSLRVTNYYGTGAGHPFIGMANIGGSKSVPLLTAANRVLGTLIGYGYDGAAQVNGARIIFESESAFSVTDNATMIRFSTGYAGGSGAIAEHMRIVSTGNVGIGTGTPPDKFSLVGGGISIDSDANGDWAGIGEFNGGLFLSGQTYGSLSYDVFVAGSGNVGIGTTAPSDPLHIEGTIRGDGQGAGDLLFDGFNVANLRVFEVQEQAAGHAILALRQTGGGAQTVSLNPNGSSYFTGGNVGIGTTTPGQKLVVNGNITGFVNGGFAVMEMRTSSDGIEAAHFLARRSRGTIGVPTYVLTGNTIGVLGFRNHTNSVGARIISKATENHSAVAAGSDLTLSTIPNGSNSSLARITITNSGNVGIGTTGPSAKLEVSGTTSGILIPRVTLVQRNAIVAPVTSELVFQTDNTPGYYYWDGAAWISFLTGSGGGGGWSTTGDAGTTVGTNFLGTTDAQDFAVYTNNAERLRVQSGGNVGIGTTAPVAKLEVDQDNLSIALYVKGGNSGNTLALFERNIGSSERFSIQASNSDVWTRYEVNPGIGTDWNVGVDETNDNFSIWTGLVVPGTTDKLSITPSGNVGIGTTSPGSKLDISGILSVAGGAATDIKLTAGANDWFLSTTNTGLDFEIYRAGQGNIFSIEQNGNVGIGTTSPTAKLQVQFNNSSISDLQFASSLYIKNSSATNNTEASILFGSDPGGRWAGIQAKLTDHTSGSINSDLRFWTVVDNSLGIRMTIKDNGNVGIGTATPAQELDVVGDVQFSAALMPGGNAGTSGQVLTSQGTGLPPVWQAASGGGGIPTEITNEIDGAGNPCVGTGCGVTQNLITCATNCSNLTFNGESDWRVATTVELVNLIPVAPGNTSTGLVWTGVAGPGSTSGRYSLVRFSDAIQGAGTGDLLQTCRCVR